MVLGVSGTDGGGVAWSRQRCAVGCNGRRGAGEAAVMKAMNHRGSAVCGRAISPGSSYTQDSLIKLQENTK